MYNGEKLGENVAMWFRTGASHYDGYEATKEWYNEIEKYKFEKGGFMPGTGHFTQVFSISNSLFIIQGYITNN